MPLTLHRQRPTRGLRTAVFCALAVVCSAVRAAEPIKDVRAVWAHATSTRNRAECDDLLADVEAAHLNCIYWLGFYWGGKCFFRTPYASMPSAVESGFDPLAYLTGRAHQRGIQVHLRFVNGENGSAEPGPFFAAHPEWALVNARGERHLWYDFANPDVREFQTELMVGALRDYPDLDGIQFDFVRYDNGEGSFTDAALRGFAKSVGLPYDATNPSVLPVLAPVRGNPVGGATTAEVLARFGGGQPAVAGNNFGSGGALLLNWHAESGPTPFVTSFLSRAIRAAKHPGRSLPAVDFVENAEWHAKYRTAAERTIGRTGYAPRWIAPGDLGNPSSLPLVLVPNAYKIAPANVESLRRYAQAGGWLVFLDGPIYSMNNPGLRELLGFSRELPCLNGLQVIVPVDYETTLFDTAGRVSPERVAACAASGDAWRRYQAGCITDLIARVHEGARRVDPSATVSACVFHRRASAESLFQNWHGWVRDGIVDQAITMAYTPESDGLRKSMREWLETDPSRSTVIPGLGIYDTDGDGRSQSPAQVLEQVRICREEGGYSSVAFFAHPNLKPELNRALAGGPFATPVALPSPRCR